jgi:hypothetical protein
MGLDQFAIAIKPHPSSTDFSIGWTNQEEFENNAKRITTWRKHANLQGWMEGLFEYKAEKQGFVIEREFNCQPVRLTAQDLEDLRQDVVEEGLPFATGFFWGETEPEDELQTLDFIEEALSYIGQGYEIYYDSWW